MSRRLDIVRGMRMADTESEAMKVLILSANPLGTDRLRLDEEVRVIQEAIRGSKHRDSFEIVSRPAVRPRDMWRALLDERPEIVHFMGHGQGHDGVTVEGDGGRAKLVNTNDLASLLALFVDHIQCVLLNACYTGPQAQAIARYIGTAIGTSDLITDNASLSFTSGFYDALGAGRSIEFAYRLGCEAMGTENGRSDIMKLYQREPPATAHYPTDRRRVFISYDRAGALDGEVAMGLAQALGDGHDVRPAFLSGQQTDPTYRLHRDIKSSQIFIAVLSENALRSDSLMGQIEFARQNHESAQSMFFVVRLGYRGPLIDHPLSAFLDQLDWLYLHDECGVPALAARLKRWIIGGGVAFFHPPEAEQWLIQPAPNLPPEHPEPPRPYARPTDLEVPGGTLYPESRFYVRRREDDEIRDALQQSGATIVITGARQMGKSSLLINMLSTIGSFKTIVYIDFQRFERVILNDADRFYHRFCELISRALGKLDRMVEYAGDAFSNNLRCTDYVRSFLADPEQRSVVLAMEETERVITAPFRDDFFGMLRSWHNERAYDSVWRKIDLMLIKSTDRDEFILERNRSPFNVGRRIRMRDFSIEQVEYLDELHGRPLRGSDVKRLFALIGGHPYMVRQALYVAAQGVNAVCELFEKAADDDGPFGDHLRYYRLRLQSNQDLGDGMLRVIRGRGRPTPEVETALLGAGLIVSDGKNCTPRCQLYADYFEIHLRG